MLPELSPGEVTSFLALPPLPFPAPLFPLVQGALSVSHVCKNPCFMLYSRESSLRQVPNSRGVLQTRRTDGYYGSLSPKSLLFHFHTRFIFNIKLFGCLTLPRREKQVKPWRHMSGVCSVSPTLCLCSHRHYLSADSVAGTVLGFRRGHSTAWGPPCHTLGY